MSVHILQFGASGALAREFLAHAADAIQITALSRADVDLTDPDAVARAIGEAGDVDLVINAAAYTAVDKAESEPELAYAVNAAAPRAMAKACAARGVPFVHFSTDMVFSGAKPGPYVETDAPGPLSIYGASKLAGEEAVLTGCDRALVIRVSWLFSVFGQNFTQTMLRLGASHPALKVVDDQRARPTASADVARFVLSQAGTLAALRSGSQEWGLLHYANEGAASRYDMAQEIFAHPAVDAAPTLEPVPATAFPLPARRAANAELDCCRLAEVFGVRPRSWRPALSDVIEHLVGG